MKKKLLIVLSIILVLALCCSLLAACNDDEEPDNPENPSGSNLKPGDSFVEDKQVTYEYDENGQLVSQTWTDRNISVNYLLEDESYVTLEGNKPSEMAITALVGHVDTFNLAEIENKLTINEEPVSVVSVADGAFAANPYLREVDLTKVNDALLFTVGDMAFTGCTALERVVLPTNTYSNNGYIGNYAFSGCVKLQSIEVNDRFAALGYGVFGGDTELSDVKLSDNITRLPANAFVGCTSLTSIELPDMLTYIGDMAFLRSGLQEVYVPDSVVHIGFQAFGNNQSMTDISLPFVGEDIVDTEHGVKQVFTKTVTGDSYSDLKITIRTAQTLEYTESGQKYGIFNGLNVANVSSIEVQKFADPGIYSVYGRSDESGSSGLAEPRELDEEDIVKKISNNAFSGFETLETVSLPAGVTSIGSSAFYGCESLESFVIPNTVLTVGARAFEGCHDLQSITFPASVYSVGDRALADCWSLQSLTVQQNYHEDPVDENGEVQSSGLAVNNVSALFDTVSYNDDYNNYELYLTYSSNDYNSTGYASGTSYKIPYSLTTVTINKTRGISNNEFNGWRNLETFNWTLSDEYYDTRYIGDYAFYGCTNLDSITIPDGFSVADPYYPEDTIDIYGIVGIGERAFQNCRSLTSITFPASVRSIEKGALAFCDSLESVTFDALETLDYIWDEYEEDEMINYDLTAPSTDSLYDLFATDYSEGSQSSPIPSGYHNTMYSANETAPTGYYNNPTLYPNSLTTVTVNGVYSLPNNFFKGMKELTTLTLGQIKFENADKIQLNYLDNPRFSVPLKVLGAYAFAGCTKLTGVDINGFEMIGEYAFQGCKLGPKVTIPDSVQYVGDHLYDNCANIDELVVDNYSKIRVTSYSYSYNEPTHQYFTNFSSVNGYGNNTYTPSSSSSHVNIKNLFTYRLADYSNVADYQYLSSTQYVPVKLAKVTLNEVENLGNIPSGCFSNLVNLKEVVLNTPSEGDNYWIISSTVVSYLANGFDGCVNLTKLTSNAEAVYVESTSSYDALTQDWEFDCGNTKIYEHKLYDGTTVVSDYKTYWYLKEEQGDDDETVQVPTAYNFDQYEDEISYVFNDVEGGKQADSPVTVKKDAGKNGVLQESDQPKDWTHDDVADKKQVLLGWSTSSSASSVNVTFPYYSTTNVNLYAVWGEEEAPDTKVEVTNVTNDHLTFTSERTIAFNGAYMVVDFNKYSDTTTWEVTFEITAKAACTVSFDYMFRASGSNGSVTCRYNIYKDGENQTGSYHSVSSSTSWSSLSSTQLDEGGYIEFRVSVPREYTPTASTELWLSNIVVVPTVVTD